MRPNLQAKIAVYAQVTVKLPADLAGWLTDYARKAGITRERFVRMELERARDTSKQPFMSLVGAIEGASDLSTRRAFLKT